MPPSIDSIPHLVSGWWWVQYDYFFCLFVCLLTLEGKGKDEGKENC
jgi:hypothetical protein